VNHDDSGVVGAAVVAVDVVDRLHDDADFGSGSALVPEIVVEVVDADAASDPHHLYRSFLRCWTAAVKAIEKKKTFFGQ